MNKNYRIMTNTDLERLEDRVNKFIDTGWSPSGGVSVGKNVNGRILYVQALIRPPAEQPLVVQG